MSELQFVTYCGLHCQLCSQRGRIPNQARQLRVSMAKDGWDKWATDMPDFNAFWQWLNKLSGEGCPGCRRGGGPPFCGIRKCARQKGVDICPLCEEFPCHRIEALAKGYVTLIADGQRMKEIGLEAWIAEQLERARTGFCYADIRCHPYCVPAE